MIRDMMENHEVIMCSPQTTVREAARMMEDQDIGALVIGEMSQIHGIVTDRDLVIRGLAHSNDCAQRPVQEFMTQDVQTVMETDNIQSIIACMRENAVRRVVIVDEAGQPCGVVSMGDVLEMLAQEMVGLVQGIAPKTDKLVEESNQAVA